MSNVNWIVAALVDLDLQKIPNYSAMAKKHEMVRIMFMR